MCCSNSMKSCFSVICVICQIMKLYKILGSLQFHFYHCPQWLLYDIHQIYANNRTELLAKQFLALTVLCPPPVFCKDSP